MNGELVAGSEFAGYRVTGLLGRGGMGFVYEAEHLLLRRKAALKTLAPGLGEGGDFKQRFIRESQTVASIDHPNIIPIYDAGELDGVLYISMRFVNGSDLDKLVAADDIGDPSEALAILEQVAGALDAAHAHAIVHRDVKPANVMIESGSGRIYLTDFGIAKQGAGPDELTRPGAFVGTADYAAPEQIEGREVTSAVDVYAFGGMLYRLLTNRRPYVRDTDIAVMFAHMSEEPPKPSAVRPELPAELDAVVARAMAKATTERFATCREVVDAARAALGGRIVAGGVPEPPAAAAPARPALRTNLPVLETALIGREEELGSVSALVRSPAVRLVTLTGFGGTGKTRLALEAAATLLHELDAAFLVDLSAVQDPQLVMFLIADALGVQETPGRPLATAIAERLGSERVLLVLDDFGHLLPASASIVELLAAAPGLKVLATSRTPLHIRGEREYPVQPLPVPSEGGVSRDSAVVQLFAERAQEVKPGFELSEANLGAVAEICRRLEGIPLAVELAAARVKILTPDQILGRLQEKRLSFLSGGGQQETLRDAIEWSSNLLDERGRSLFARLGVFSGGISLETAESVAGQPLGLEFGEVLDRIAALVDHGLVRQVEAADGEPRFRMLETIREFALERLAAADEVDDTRNRHLARFVELAETTEPELTRAGQSIWLERLSEENDNIRAALAWSVESGQIELGLRLAGSLVRFWSVRGLMSEGRRWLAEALEAGEGVQPAVLAKGYFAAGFAALGQGDYAEAKPLFERSLLLAREAGNTRIEAQALQQIGWLVLAAGTYKVAHAERARELAGKALELAGDLDDKVVQSGALNILAELAAEEGNEASANELYERSLALRRELGDKRLIANSVLTLGCAELSRGNTAHAAALLEEARTLAAALGDTWSVSLAKINLGRLALLDGEVDAAATLFAESLELARGRGDKRVAAECLQGLGAVGAARGDAAPATRLLAAAGGLLDAIGVAPANVEVMIGERFVPPLQHSLGEEAFAAEWAAGRALSTDEAIEQGLLAAGAER